MKLTHARVKELFDYDPETGELSYLKNRNGSQRSVTKRAGYRSNQGYLDIKVDGKSYRLHRVVWLWVHGYFPEGDLDHINRVRDDNRLSNLRESSRSCNVFNSKKRADSPALIRGVCECRDTITEPKFLAYIGLNRKVNGLMRTSDFTEAVAHRFAAEQCLGVSSADEIETEAAAYMRRYLESCA